MLFFLVGSRGIMGHIRHRCPKYLYGLHNHVIFSVCVRAKRNLISFSRDYHISGNKLHPVVIAKKVEKSAFSKFLKVESRGRFINLHTFTCPCRAISLQEFTKQNVVMCTRDGNRL